MSLFKLEKLKLEELPRKRTAFYASDYGRADLDLYFSFMGEPKTNPAIWNESLKWGAGNGVEAKMLEILKSNKIVPPEYDQRVHGRIDIERAGVTIHGYIDAATSLDSSGIPIEIKSINNKNFPDIQKYKKGYPRESYVGQLAIYMDARNLDIGYLFVASVDGLSYFLFKCRRLKDGRYKCGKTYVDLDEFYARMYHLKINHIDKKKIPDIWQYVYKYPVDKIDWTKVSASDISKARMNRKVLGDYQIGWSDWKDKIIKLQKQKKGYSNKELMFIQRATKGYSSKKKTKSQVAE